MKKNEFRLGTDNPVLIIKFIVSAWCNYSCDYCNFSKSTKIRKSKFYSGIRSRLKNLAFRNSVHAFDNYPVEKWLEAFGKIPNDFIVEISGGEPFLDYENFPIFLEDLGKLDKCKLIRIDTNGFWDGKNYKLSDRAKDKVALNISYHPSQAKWEPYTQRISAIQKSGWKIRMINYVMNTDQESEYERIKNYFETHENIFVNPNPDKFGDAERLKKELARYYPPVDLVYKVGRTSPQGKKCYYPSITYVVQPTGETYRGCIKSEHFNFIKKSSTLFPLKEPLLCPSKKCPCLDMYAFLEESGRGQVLDLLKEYVDACRKYSNNLASIENQKNK